MSDNKDNDKKSIFTRIVQSASDTLLDYQIKKARATMELEKAQLQNKRMIFTLNQ